MIDAFETSVRINQNAIFFTFVDSAGNEASYTYRQARLISAALARRLNSQGAVPGTTVVADVPNSPELVFLILASAYGDFALALLDNSASEADKVSQTLSLERCGLDVPFRIDHQRLMQILGRSRDIARRPMDESAVIGSINGGVRRERSIMGERQDVIDDTVHFAERAAHLFDGKSQAFVTFTSGEFGKSKIVPLDWNELMEASKTANRVLAEQGRQLWQEKLPISTRNSINLSQRDAQSGSPSCSWQCVYRLSHIRGFQILVRSVVARTPLRIYENFDAELVLKDCERSHVTHISVSDRMLQDLLTVEEWRADIQSDARIRLAEYQCILIDDRQLNPRTVERSLDLGVRIFAGYGIPETSGLMAQALITSEFRGGMKLMDGYQVHIVDENEDGFGRLAVQGPGVFKGYLNASTAFTLDHYFITGHTAALYEGCIYIRNRSADMFIADGESVYPEEIADILRHVPGVSAVHVFGMQDMDGSSYPVAVVERTNPSLTAEAVLETASPWLRGACVPKRIHMSDSLPRTESGKLDRPAIESMLRDRLDIAGVVVTRIRVPFNEPVLANGNLHGFRDAAIVQVCDHMGRVGLGECMAYDSEWGTAETLGNDVSYIEAVLAPFLAGRTVRHPREISELFAELPEAQSHTMACSAVECAVWDAFGAISQKPLWEMLNQEYSRIQKLLDDAAMVPSPSDSGSLEAVASCAPTAVAQPEVRMAEFCGNSAVVYSDAVIRHDSSPVVMANAHSAVAAGYRRLKMQITPEKGYASVRSVRRAFPDLLITLDANCSFTEDDMAQLKAYDSLNIGWIEEPFSGSGSADPLAQLASAQHMLATPLCADESYCNASDAYRILLFNDIHCVSVKVAKFGGIEPALRFIALAKRQGKVVCMGGMHETGIGRRVSAAFETLPGIVFPGDIGSISRYFKADITYPPYEAHDGMVTLNGEGFPFGLGCTLNEEVFAQVAC